MAKLFSSDNLIIPRITTSATGAVVSTEVLFSQLDQHLQAYHSVQRIYAEVASESLTFVDSKNSVLFNEYIHMLQRTLGVSPKTVCPLAMESLSPVTVNAELSLEGWMGDMWKKIKGFFIKIFDSVKEFMKRHFTRLGRLKNKLKNLQEVASETKSDLKQPRLDDAPSGLTSKMKGFSDITEASISEVIKTAGDVVAQMKVISDLTTATAKSGMVTPEFISDIKKLREIALAANKQIDANKEQKGQLGIVKDRKERSQINKDNKSLAETAKNATANADQNDSTLASVEDDTDDELQRKGQEAFKAYGEKLVSTLGAFKGKKMVGGKTIAKVELNTDNELVVEFDEQSDEPKGVNLTNREGIITLCKAAEEVINEAEKQGQVYGKVNDEIMKQLNAVDTLIIDIDRTDAERYGKYRRILDQRIRTRLNMVKATFRSYNQVNRNFFETVLATGDVVVDYSVLSLKHF